MAGLPRPPLRHLLLVALALMLGSLLIGPSGGVSLAEVWHWCLQRLSCGTLAGEPADAMVEAVLLDVRLPRVLLAFLVGAALTVSGAALQAMFRNPLVSPDILGLSSGAAFGAALAVSLPFLPLQPTAFLGGLLAVAASYFLARRAEGVSLVALILAGIIVSGVFTALLATVQFLTDPFRLQTIVHWTMGNLHQASWSKLASAAGPILAGLGWLYLLRWRMNVMALGDAEARAVGLDPEREKLLILLPATLVASAAVAVAGIIGLVGLAVPHMVRLLVGPDQVRALPVAILCGGALLLLVDDCSRSLTAFELPVGIFTTLIGGPFFIYLLGSRRLGGWGG